MGRTAKTKTVIVNEATSADCANWIQFMQNRGFTAVMCYVGETGTVESASGMKDDKSHNVTLELRRMLEAA